MDKLKLKRKEFELHDSSYDFSDFSFSSPACKIRRLDSELPPIIEDEEAEIPPTCGPSLSENDVKPPVDVELPMVPENEERAIVLFTPRNNPQFHLSSNYSVDSNLISSFKSEALLGNYWNAYRPIERDKLTRNGDIDTEENTCRAVIPWAPSQHLDQIRSNTSVSQAQQSEPMDAEEVTMEIDETSIPYATQCISPSRMDDDVQHHQWQQQHCMIPQAPPDNTTPLVWYR